MPRSSRTKSRKHSSREVRDYSDSEEDLKKNETSLRVSKDLMAGEKRKVSVKDLLSHGNGDVVDEVVVVSKRRKEKVEGGGSDRWNAGDENDVFVDVKSENLSSRAKEKEKEKEKERVLVEFSRSKSGRRHESDKKEEVVEEESKSGRVESKRKGEKEHGRKEYKEKEKERLDKEKVVVEDGELARKHSVDVNEERHGKRGRENIGKLCRV